MTNGVDVDGKGLINYILLIGSLNYGQFLIVMSCDMAACFPCTASR